MKKISALLFTLFTVSCIIAQNGQVKGKLVSTAGEPVPYANIVLKNTTKGTYSKINGNFNLTDVSSGNQIIVISGIGYETKEVSFTITPNQTVDLQTIAIKENTQTLNEVTINGSVKNKFLVKKPSHTLRLKTETVKLPQNIQIISKDLLENQNILSMMESVTRNISGAQMIEHWGHFARINMRGFKLPAFRNGMNVEMPWGPLSEDMSMVQNIEFVKGPSGFMMAAGEPGGFYNVVTKKPTEIPINEITFTVGSFNNFRGTLDSGGKLTNDGKLLYRFNAMYQSADSHRDFEDSERYSIVPSLRYNFSDKTSITTELTYQHSTQLIGAAYVFARPEDGLGAFKNTYTSIDKGFPETDIEEVSLLTNFTHNFNDKWSVEAQHMFMRYNQEGASFWVYGIDDDGNALRNVSIWDALNTNQLGQVYFNGEVTTGPLTHKLMGGFDFRDLSYYAIWGQGGFIDAPTAPFNIYNPVYGNATYPEFNRSQSVKVRGKDNHQGTKYTAYYLQDEIWTLNDKLRITLAARYTDAEVFAYGQTSKDNKITPRLGVSYDVLPNLTVYGLYDQAFLPQFGVSATGQRFDPEEATDIEGGIKKTWLNGKLRTSLTAYQITKENILVGDPNNPNFSIQLGEVQSKGIELDIQGQVTPQLDVVLNYANTNVEITKDTDPNRIGTKIAGHAKHITNGWAHYTFGNKTKLKGFGLSLGYQYQVDRSSWSWNADNEAILPDYFRLDGGISWRNRNIRINLNVNNILDKHLFSGTAYSSYIYWQSEPGINGRLSIAYKF